MLGGTFIEQFRRCCYLAGVEWELKSSWDSADKKKVMSFAEDYKKFLGKCKTERETVSWAVRQAKKKGFTEYDGKPSPGKKYYFTAGEKAAAFIVIGRRKELRIAAAHADSPRIDLKPRPVVEDSDLALLKGHYYGGIKKYQWVNHPLAMHGVVFKQDGKRVDIIIGEKQGDPVFVIPDLLPHLAAKQMKKTAEEVIEGEALAVLAGNTPSRRKNGSKKRFKLGLLEILNKKYGITEEDLTSAELELVPAGPPADLGLDNSMVLGYGQDDRSSCYAVLRALFDYKTVPQNTLAVFLLDREEIGSVGKGGASTSFLENVFAKVCGLENAKRLLEDSKMISADVGAALNPLYKDAYDPSNATYLGRGVGVFKYTGRKGKYDSSEATAEYFAWIRNVLNKAGIPWQTGELGKVDLGGGGTVAAFLAKHGGDVIDMGVCLLSMHSPAEVSSKIDLYNMYRAITSFFKEK